MHPMFFQPAYDIYGRQINVNPYIEVPSMSIQSCPFEIEVEKNDVIPINNYALEELNSMKNQVKELTKKFDDREIYWKTVYNSIIAQRDKAEANLSTISHNAQHNQKNFELYIESLKNELSTKSNDLSKVLEENKKLSNIEICLRLEIEELLEEKHKF